MTNSNSKLTEKKGGGNNRRKKLRSLKSFFIALFVSAFLLNWFWEIIQVPAYESMSGFSMLEKIGICTRASLADAAITLGIYGTGALATRQLRWAMNGGWKHYLVFVLLGAAAATLIEWLAITFDFWRYHGQMPIVPILGVGLYPFLQLTLLAPAALWLALWWCGRDTE